MSSNPGKHLSIQVNKRITTSGSHRPNRLHFQSVFRYCFSRMHSACRAIFSAQASFFDRPYRLSFWLLCFNEACPWFYSRNFLSTKRFLVATFIISGATFIIFGWSDIMGEGGEWGDMGRGESLRPPDCLVHGPLYVRLHICWICQATFFFRGESMFFSEGNFTAR